MTLYLKKVLIVEDDPMFAKALKRKFGDAGITAEVVYTGEDAVRLLGTPRNNIKLILSDTQLDGGKNGHEFVPQYKSHNIEIMGMSGIHYYAREWSRAGVPDFFNKTDLTDAHAWPEFVRQCKNILK